jgi:hypothetical protein
MSQLTLEGLVQPKQPSVDANSDCGEIPEGIRRSQEAYWSDLPELVRLKSRSRRWVAYHGDERVGFGKTSAELYDRCLRVRKLRKDDFYVDRLEPRANPPWEAEAIDSPRVLLAYEQTSNDNA